MKWRYRIAIGLGVLAILIVAAIAVLFQTQAGLNWAIGLAESHSHGALSIAGARGTLAGPIEIDHLTLDLDGALITVAHAKLDWSPTALAAGKIKVSRLSADHIEVSVKPTRREQANTTFKLPEQIDLSWHYIVDSAQLHALDISTPERKLNLSLLGFALDANAERIKLSALQVVNKRFKLSGKLRLEPHGIWKLAANIKEQIRVPNYPALTAHSQLAGGLRGTLLVAQDISSPFTATLQASIKQLFDQPVVQGNLHLVGLNLSKLRSSWPDLTTSAAIDFHGSRKNLNARGSLATHGKTTAKIGFDLQAAVLDKRLRIGHLHLALLGLETSAPTPASRIAPSARLSLHGNVALSAPHTMQIESSWHDLRWPPEASNPEVLVRQGSAKLKGTINDWSVQALGQLKIGKPSPGRWLLMAHGSAQAITITGLAGRWLDGRVFATGKLSLENRQPFELRLITRNLNPGPMLAAAQMPRKVGFDLSAQGAIGPLDARIQLEQLTGQLHGKPITGRARIEWTDKRLAINQFELSAGPNHLTLQGQWSERPHLAWQLQAPELRLFAPELGGRIEAQGTISGTRKAPLFKARLSGEALHWRSLRIKQAQAQASFSAGKKAIATLNLSLKNIKKGAAVLGDLAFSLSGPAQAQHFTLDAHNKRGMLHLAGTGKLAASLWQGTLRQGKLRSAGTALFTLQAPAAIVLGKQRLKLAQSCWQNASKARMCVAGSSNKAGWKAAVKLYAIPLALANPFLAGTRLSGELDGHITARGGSGRLHVLAMVHAGPGSIVRRIQGKKAHFNFNEAGLEVRINDDIAQARLGVLAALGGMLDVRIRIPWRKHRTPTGQIKIIAHLPDLSNVDALSSAIDQLSGRLDADFSLSGSLQKPSFAGHIALSHAGFTLPRFGTRVANAWLSLRGDGPRLVLSAHLEDGKKGHLALHGQLLRNMQKWALEASVEGKSFLIANTPVARLVVSPKLDIRLKNHHLNVNGEISIPAANITPPDFANAITPSTDMVIVGQKPAESNSPIAVHARVTLRLGNDVHFKGFGLDAQFGGQLTLIQEPQELTTASGEIKILNGHYKAYGVRLKIVQGALLFSGGWVANPSLNLRAERSIASATVGLHITGSLRKPRMDIYSDPPMSESNALAYLLFGHGVRQNSGDESSLQAQAANALGIASATFLAKSLGQHIGVDTVTVESASPYSSDANQASLFLGKYLSPRLYVSYGIGLYEPINLLRIHYTLSRHWALEAESGTISGADILFQISF